MQQVIEQQAHQVTLVAVKDEPHMDLRPFDKIVIGASIRYGRHSPLIIDFIKRNAQLLESRTSAFFSVNIVARKANDRKFNPASFRATGRW